MRLIMKKKKIALIIDSEGWAFDNIAKQIKKNLIEYDIDIIGIGIQTIQITETYPNHIYVKDLDTLPDMLIQKLKELAI